MRKLAAAFLIVSMALIAGCGGQQARNDGASDTQNPPAPAQESGTPAPATQQAEAPNPAAPTQTHIVVSYSAVKQIPYAASLIAWQELKAQGYDIEPKFMPKSELSVQALLQGESDLAQVNPIAAASAIANGGKLAIVAAIALNHWALVADADIKAPADLSGKKIAVHSETSMSNTVVQYAMQKYGIKDPNILIIPGSPARAQALMSGQVDATSVFLTDAVRLDTQAPGKYPVLIDFKDMPVVDSVLVARRDWLADHQTEIHDILRALLETHRHIQADPDWAVQQATSLYSDEEPAFVDKTIREYAARGIWDANGGLPSPDDISNTIIFLKTVTKELPETASEKAEDYADLGPLNAVLGEIGKK